LGIRNDAVISVLGMLLLLVHWECCYYFCICNDVVICVLVMMLFVYWE
jgi:hypothetical protein